MNLAPAFRLACLVAVSSITFHAHAESFASSASSAGSASSGSVSASLRGSSNSSTDGEKTANGDYRITEIAAVPDQADFLRVTMQIDNTQQQIVLDLPAPIFAKQGLVQGDLIRAERRVYGLEFARGDTHEPFYLVLADEWHDELAPRPVVHL